MRWGMWKGVASGAEVPRFWGAQVFRYSGSEIPMSWGSQVFRFPGPEVPRCSGSKVPRFPGVQVPRSWGFPGVQVPRSWSSQVFRFWGAHAPRSPGASSWLQSRHHVEPKQRCSFRRWLRILSSIPPHSRAVLANAGLEPLTYLRIVFLLFSSLPL